MIDVTILESLQRLRVVSDQSHRQNQPATIGGVLHAIPSGSQKMCPKTPFAGDQGGSICQTSLST